MATVHNTVNHWLACVKAIQATGLTIRLTGCPVKSGSIASISHDPYLDFYRNTRVQRNRDVKIAGLLQRLV